ncbi:mucin-5AC-like [Megalops cyprinoides]|uniref:mucin-5AC-like n=1 Tax=Megalops cyprinoides TaxID=118141 RepID=UPI0018644303|nr:mucin-5AC-like [Megalops cyprinoides]
MKLQILMTLAFAFVVIDTSMAQVNSTSATNATMNATSPAPSGSGATNATMNATGPAPSGSGATNATMNPTSPAPSGSTVTNASTSTNGTVTTTPSATTVAPGSTAVLLLVFSTNETFTSALSDSNSQAFKDRVTRTKNVIEPVYKRAFASFLRLVVLRFRSGSIVTDAELVFNSSGAVPSAQVVATTLRDAVENGTVALPINASSISVTNPPSTTTTVAATTSGVSPVTSPVLTCLMVTLASFLLTSVFRFS